MEIHTVIVVVGRRCVVIRAVIVTAGEGWVVIHAVIVTAVMWEMGGIVMYMVITGEGGRCFMG